MAERPVALIVHQTGSCALLREGDHWVFTGKELNKLSGVRICASGVCHLYPKLRRILDQLGTGATLPDDYLLCEAPNCDAAFRMEFVETSPAPQRSTTRMTRRLEQPTPSSGLSKASLPFLARLPKELAAELIGACKTMRFDEGQIILMQGVVGKHLYIMAEGMADVARRGENDETILVTLNRGDCFGEMSILTGEVTSAEVRSKGPCAVLTLHHDELEKLLLHRPVLSREFSKLLAERLKATNASLESELSRGILGKLSMISLLDLVQTLSQSRRTGTLILSAFGEQAKLGFRNGVLCSALVSETLGDEAFYEVLCWPDGDFRFEQTEPDANDPARVHTDTMGLMMEGMRRLDELKASKSVAKKQETVFVPPPVTPQTAATSENPEKSTN